MAIDHSRPLVPVRFAVLTVSDSRTLETDRSGDTLVSCLEAAGHTLADRRLVQDDATAIRQAVLTFVADDSIDAVLTTGGTGLTGRDITPDTIEPLFHKRMDGFAAVFHTLSFPKIGTSTIQSRCCAGLIATTFVFVLPGSPSACRDAWEGVLSDQFDSRFRPCNLVEVMPRLSER